MFSRRRIREIKLIIKINQDSLQHLVWPENAWTCICAAAWQVDGFGFGPALGHFAVYLQYDLPPYWSADLHHSARKNHLAERRRGKECGRENLCYLADVQRLLSKESFQHFTHD